LLLQNAFFPERKAGEKKRFPFGKTPDCSAIQDSPVGWREEKAEGSNPSGPAVPS